ncbi:MAG: FAD-dependent oxidoreductase [Patescibacteria group bacterium]|jgi:thioredoxin reductase (NADPH)
MEITYLESDIEFESWKKTWPILVVDFFSDECPPCEKLAPIYEKMSKSFPSVKFIKVFRQQHRELAGSLGVGGSPTVLFFKSGQLIDERLSGDIEEKEIEAILEKLCGESGLKINTDNQEIEQFDLCIIGHGPAGMTAAIYAARYKINQILVGDLPGGLMTSSHKICNFPSEIEISGMDLSEKMVNQVKALEVPQKLAAVTSINQVDKIYNIVLSSGESIKAKTVLLATGTKHRHLGLPNEKLLTGRGVSYCATCDALFYKDKTVAVIGGSDSASTAAIYLAQVASKVYQIYRGDSLRGETAWIDQVKLNKKISVIYNTQITELLGLEKLTGIKLDKPFEGKDELNIDGVFVEVGSEPDLDLINQLSLETDKGHYIVTKENQATSREGVWAAGDITTNSNSFRQIVTACSEGAIAAENIFKYLQKNH